LKASCSLVGSLARETPAETTVSDVVSLKAPLARAVAEAGAQARWVGSHPMTGSAESGFDASRADLYQGARVWTVAHPSAEPRAARLHALWKALGARPAAIEAVEHDRLMAVASHLPQLVANALASVLAQHDVTPEQLGPGGTDMTRLAASSPEMWRDIFEHASPDLAAALRALAEASGRMADLIEGGDLDDIEGIMKHTRTWSGGG
jgi:prephenate dehydrogenase